MAPAQCRQPSRWVFGTITPAAAPSRSPDCGGKLCGRLVWLKNAKHKDGCNLQIFGDVRPVAAGKWDGGWIIDPEKDLATKYSVELTLLNPKSLKVVGYLGTKLLSETMMWQKAPNDLKRCGA